MAISLGDAVLIFKSDHWDDLWIMPRPVFWHNIPHMARFVSSTELQVSVTADDLTIFGLVQVYVQTGG